MRTSVVEPSSGQPPSGRRGRRRLTLDRLPSPVVWMLVALAVLAGAAAVTAPVWSGHRPDPNTRTQAVLAETRDPADGSRVTGRFDVSLAVLGATGRQAGPRQASLADALAWADARSPRVEVVGGDGRRYSAGSTALPGMPVLPEGTSFSPRFAYEPTGGPLPRAWWVRLTFDSSYPSAPAIAERLAGETEALRIESAGDTRVIAIRLPARRDQSVIVRAGRIAAALDGDSATAVAARGLGTVARAGDSGLRVTLAGHGTYPAPPRPPSGDAAG